MKKIFYLLLALLISQNLLAQTKTWTGATSTNWATASNWSPSGVPNTTNDAVVIDLKTNQPTISGTVPNVNLIYVNSGATLTVNSGGTLNASSTTGVITLQGGNLINDGTINVSGGGTSVGLAIGATASITNRGTITTNNLYGASLQFGNLTFTNESTGIFTGDFKANNNILTLTNRGTINYAGGTYALSLGSAGSSVINNGTISVTAGSGISNPSGSTITNNACGKILTTTSGYENGGTTNNTGLIQLSGTLINTSSFTNNNGGVLKYGTLTGTITNNNGSVRVNDNPTNSTIFTYQGTFTGTINGIYTNAAATTIAGTFTAPNTFTPSGTLPTGSQTLYAKITPSGGACNYVVPFTYNNIIPPSITTTGTLNAFSACSGTASASQSFTVSGANLTANIIVTAPTGFEVSTSSNGTYSGSVTLTRSGSSVANTSIFVRLKSTATGTLSGNITCTSTGATAQNIVATGTVTNTPTLIVGTATNPTTCAGTDGSIAFTTTNLTNGTYTLNYSKNSVATTASITVSANAFTLTGLTAGTYTPFSITNSGCSTGSITTSKILTDPATPTLTVGTSVNPTTCTGTNGSIAFTTTNLANGTYTLNYSKNSIATTASITVSANAFTLTGLTAGTYTPFSITNNGCSTGTVTTSKVLTDPATPTLTVGTSVNPSTCGGTNGSIPFTSTNLPNGTYSLSFTATGAGATTSPQSITVSENTFSLTGLKAGTYSAFSVTNVGCTGTVATSKVLADPATPTLTIGTSVNPSTCGGANGSIPFTSTNLPNGTYSLSFTATGAGATTSPQSVTVSGNAFSLTGLKAGTYSNFSLTTLAGCTGTVATPKTLTDPTAPTLTAGTATNPTTCGGTGSIAFTSTNLANGTYSLSFTGTGSPKNVTVSANTFTLSGLTAGTYSNFSLTTAAGCTGTVATPKTLTDPTAPTLIVGTSVNPTTCGGANGSIPFTSTNLPNGTYSLSFTAMGTGATTSPQNVTVSANAFTLSGLKAGTYSSFSVTTLAGCTGTIATPKTLTDPAAPTLTAGTSVNPPSCAGANGSIPFTSTNLPNGTYSLSFTATGTGATTSPKSITVSANTFSLTGLKAGTYSNFSLTTVAGCTGSDASSKILTDPATPTISAGTVVNPATCGATGSIPFTATNLPNGTYSLSFTATGAGATTSPRNVVVTSNSFSLIGLSVGNYSGFSLTSTGCTATDASSKSIANPTTPTLTAGVAVNPIECGGTDGSIPFTTNLPNGTYSLSYTGTGSPKSITVSSGAFTLGTLGSGGYNNFLVTNNGCIGTANTPRSLSDPAAPVLTLGTTTNPTACNLSDGTIAFTVTNITDGTYSLTYSGAGSPQTVTVSSGAFTLSGLADGTYSNFSITNLSGCTGSLATPVTLVDLALPVLMVGTSTNPTTCFGTNGTIAFTSANLPNGTYSLSFTTTGAASPKSITVASNAFTLSGLSAGDYSNFSVTNTGCTGTVATLKTLSNPATPSLLAGTHTNPTTCLGTDGTIAFTTTNLANGTYSLSFTTTGTSSPKSVTVTNNTFTLTRLSAGNYNTFSLTNNGCTAMDESSISLNNPATPTILAGLVTAPTSCSAADGSIAFASTNLPNGSYTITYTGVGSPKIVTVTSNAFALTGLDDGTYSNFSITNLGCTASDATSKTVNNPAPPTLMAGLATNPTTCASTDGSIAFTTTLPNGTYTLNYTGAGNPKSVTVLSGAFTLTGLPDGTFSGFSITNAGCISSATTTKVLTDPASPTLTAGLATNPTTCASTDGTIAFTTTLPNGTYTINYTGAGSPQTVTVTSGVFSLIGLPDGTFSGFSVTTGGCTGTSSATKILTDPAAPTLTAGLATNPTTCASTDGTIAFTTSLPNGTYSLVYTGLGSPQNITVVSGAFNLTGLPEGTFSGFSVTTGGCTGTSSAIKTLTDPAAPTLTAGLATNPSTCLSSDGSIAFTTSLPNGTYSLSYTGSGSPKSITVLSGVFTLTGLPEGTFSGFSVTTGGCTGTSSATKTLTDPAAPTLTAGLATNPSTCLGSDGSIAFTTSLPNGTYSLVYTGSGSPQNITVASGAFTLGNLPDGAYSGFSVTNGGCTGASSATKTLTDPAAPTLTVGTITNPTTCSGSDGSIAFTTTLANGTYTLNYTGLGSPKSITVTSGAFTLTDLLSGTYSGFSVTTGGCTGIDNETETLTDPIAPSITAGTITDPTTCSGVDGSITFTSTNLPDGTYSLNFTVTGSVATTSPKNVVVSEGGFSLIGLSSGSYSNFSITNSGCTGTDEATKTLISPVAPTITAGLVTNPTTCLGTNGNIAFTSTNLPDGTYSLIFTGAGTGATVSPKNVVASEGIFSLTGLAAGTYSNFSITNLGCTGTDEATKTLINPTAPTITAGTVTNPTTCLGTDGNIAFSSTNLPDGTYSLSFTSTGSVATAAPKNVVVSEGGFALNGLSSGTYSNFSVTNDGCTGTDVSSKNLSDPASPFASTNDVTICEVTTLNLNASGGTIYTWSGPNSFSSTSQNPLVSSTATTAMAGIYTIIVSNTSACTASATANVIINATPATPTPNAIAPIYPGGSATLTASGCTGSLFWYTTIGDVSVTNPVSPTATTDYYATCEVSANGITCTSRRSTNVTITIIGGQIVYVDASNDNPTQDGTTWATAFADLQIGLASAESITGTPVEVWVAKGTYKPTTTTTRTIYFNIPSGVKVYGGFVGTETALTQRDFKINNSILSGDIGTQNIETDNSYHVVVFDGSSTLTALDGFTISGGYANFDPRRVFLAPNSNAISTVTIETGGGIAIQNMGKPTISNCTIIKNSAVTGGGLFVSDASTPNIVACKFMGNQAGFGSGIYFQDGSSGTVNNTLISGNRGIGAVYNNTSNPILTNCTLSGNGGYNGGIFNSNSQPVVKNSIISGNSTPFNDTQSIITYSVIQGGYSGIGNLNYDPQFVSQTPEGLSPNTTGDYHLKANSLAIDRGDNGLIPTTELDLDGNPRRFAGGTVDMGAFEFQGTASVSLVISVQSGNWEINATWDIGRVPQLGDYVIINDNHTVTINAEGTAKNLEYRNNAVLKFGNSNAKLKVGY